MRIAATFFEELGRATDRACACLKYLIRHRTPSGAWTATGSTEDSHADPLTTAYVLRTLIDSEEKGLLGGIDFKNRDTFLTTYKNLGMTWLHQNLVCNGYRWLYQSDDEPVRPDSLARSFCDTADILARLPEFGDANDDHAEAQHQVFDELAEIWRSWGVGLPDGPNSETIGLGATAHFATACWRTFPPLASELVTGFLDRVEDLLAVAECDSVGLAVTLGLITEACDPIRTVEELADIRSSVERMWSRYHRGGERATRKLFGDYPDWVRTIAVRRILPVEAVPPPSCERTPG